MGGAMSIVLQSTGGGSVTLQEPSTASTFTQTLPSGTGTVVVSGINSAITSGTAASATSTSVDFTGIPSWVRRITVMFNGVSTNGTSNIQIQIGSGSVTTSGYASQMWGSTSFSSVVSTGFVVFSPGSAANTYSGFVMLSLISANTWTESGALTYANANSAGWTSAGNSGALSGALDRVRITTVNGTDTFDAGTINILYE